MERGCFNGLHSHSTGPTVKAALSNSHFGASRGLTSLSPWMKNKRLLADLFHNQFENDHLQSADEGNQTQASTKHAAALEACNVTNASITAFASVICIRDVAIHAHSVSSPLFLLSFDLHSCRPCLGSTCELQPSCEYAIRAFENTMLPYINSLAEELLRC